jgi:hypothetical protein
MRYTERRGREVKSLFDIREVHGLCFGTDSDYINCSSSLLSSVPPANLNYSQFDPHVLQFFSQVTQMLNRM